VINIFFLSVGLTVYLCRKKGIEVPTDLVTENQELFVISEIAFHHLTLIPSVIFLLGLTAATFATTDSANGSYHFILCRFFSDG
jgi:hypothetical protein